MIHLSGFLSWGRDVHTLVQKRRQYRKSLTLVYGKTCCLTHSLLGYYRVLVWRWTTPGKTEHAQGLGSRQAAAMAYNFVFDPGGTAAAKDCSFGRSWFFRAGHAMCRPSECVREPPCAVVKIGEQEVRGVRS